MSDKVVALRKSLDRERNKLARQRDAVEATVALIEVLEAQIAAAEKKK